MTTSDQYWYVMPLASAVLITGLSGAIFFGAVRKHRATQRRHRRVGRL